MNKKIDLNKLVKGRSNAKISKEEMGALLRTKGDELSGKRRVVVNENETVNEEAKIVVKSNIVNDELDRLLRKLPDSNRFIEGVRQQSSINTSDYTSCLIDILIEAKKRDGEKIKKTSYLEKYIIQGVKKELMDLGIEVK